jgi:hypothetical protein
MLLGGENDIASELCQLVAIPDGANSAWLGFWWQIRTEQIAHPRDYLYLEIRDAAGGFLANLYSLSDDQATGKWSPAPFFDLSAYAGQSVWICFICQTNGSLPTWFYVDDVGLNTCTTASPSMDNLLPEPNGKQSKLARTLILTRSGNRAAISNTARIFTAQTGWISSNVVINLPFGVAIPLIVKP